MMMMMKRSITLERTKQPVCRLNNDETPEGWKISSKKPRVLGLKNLLKNPNSPKFSFFYFW